MQSMYVYMRINIHARMCSDISNMHKHNIQASCMSHGPLPASNGA